LLLLGSAMLVEEKIAGVTCVLLPKSEQKRRNKQDETKQKKRGKEEKAEIARPREGKKTGQKKMSKKKKGQVHSIKGRATGVPVKTTEEIPKNRGVKGRREPLPTRNAMELPTAGGGEGSRCMSPGYSLAITIEETKHGGKKCGERKKIKRERFLGSGHLGKRIKLGIRERENANRGNLQQKKSNEQTEKH